MINPRLGGGVSPRHQGFFHFVLAFTRGIFHKTVQNPLIEVNLVGIVSQKAHHIDSVTDGDGNSIAYDNGIRIGQVDNGIGKGIRIFKRGAINKHYGMVVPQIHIFLDGRLPGAVDQGHQAQSDP